jgi:hypothetical protein
MENLGDNCSYCGQMDHGVIHCNSDELRQCIRNLCIIVGENNQILFHEQLHQYDLELLYAIVAKLTLWNPKEYFANSTTHFIRTELIMMIKTYFEQFISTIFDNESESVYRNISAHKKRATNFGRVAYIRQMITTHPDSNVRDIYLMNPNLELQAFPDLLLNSYWYHTSYQSQIQLPRPISPEQETIRQQVSNNMNGSFQYRRSRHIMRSTAKPIPSNPNALSIPIAVSLKASTTIEECCICYETLAPTKNVQYDCDHSYCINCAINVYKTHHKSCAMCRKTTNALHFQNNGEFACGKQMINHDGDIAKEFDSLNSIYFCNIS